MRAVSNAPLGPFHIEETVVPRFAHEPNVVTAPDGSFVMFYFAANCSGGQCGELQTCPRKSMWPWNVSQPGVPDAPEGSAEASSIEPSAEVKLNYMMHAKNPEGPWSEPVLLSPGPACSGGPTKAFAADLNLNAAIAPDGSLSGLWRCIETLPTTQPGATVLHAVTASDWRNVSSYRWSPTPAFAAQGFGSEDPFVWIARDGSFHAILHDEQGLPGKHYPNISRSSAYGRHAWSRTGELGNWSISPWGVPGLGGSLAYNSLVHFSDGSSHEFYRRERPHLVLGEDKSLIALTNGASPDTDTNEMCFTLTQPIRGGESRAAPPSRTPPPSVGLTERADNSQQIFTHFEGGYKCIRIPTLVTASDGTVIAIAEGRHWTGDGCNPNSSAFNQSDSRTDLVFKRSTTAGKTWSGLGLVASQMGNANAVVLESGEVAVLAMGHPAYSTPNFQLRSTDVRDPGACHNPWP